jgi:hypothetical protein
MIDTGKNGGVTPSMRSNQINITIDEDDKLMVLKGFVKELWTGKHHAVVTRYFGAFVNVDANSLVSYPLCFVKEILTILCINEAVVRLLDILSKLENNLTSKHSGVAWECTVETAIVLQMLQAHWFCSQGPFYLVPEGTKPELAFRMLPDECESLIGAKALIDEIVVQYSKPTLIFVKSASARYPQVEGFVVYTSGSLNKTTAKIVGFQMKTADVKPRDIMDTSVINGGAVLIRGRALAKNPRPPAKHGWRYMTSKEVQDFLGHSLLLAMPRDWLHHPKV